MKNLKHFFIFAATVLIGSGALAEVNVKSFPFNACGNGITDDTNAIRAALATGDSTVYLPPGIYRITSYLYVGDAQRLRGDGISSADGHRGTLLWFDSVTGVAVQVGGADGFTRNGRVETIRIRGNGPINQTTGIRLGDPELNYSCNSFAWHDVIVEGFGVGFDNYASDASSLTGGGIWDNNINGRTQSNDFLHVRDVSNQVCRTYGWQVTGSGSGLQITGGVSAGQPCHIRGETGSNIRVQGVWFEGCDGAVAWCDMATNSSIHFDTIHCMFQGSTIPFVKMEYNGLLKYSGCRGVFSFVAGGAPVIVGEGEPGTLNGSPYTAGGYPATP